uniref:Uncharacterized protein n=1 Tax=Dulem virus 146 TaxID=3145623 RepID=A0AAU8B779_9VIRU
MKFYDLCVSCKNWEESTNLIVVSGDDFDGQLIPVRSAKVLYKDRRVLWFKDCVVMLL